MTPRPLRAVLFDLDGTLADTAPDLVAAVGRMRRRLGLPAVDLSGLPPLAGQGAVALMTAGIPEFQAAERREQVPQYLEEYRSHCWEASQAYDGVPDLLQRLAAMGLKIAVVTNKLRMLAEPVIEQAGWDAAVDVLVAGDDVERPKPAPDPVEAACRQLGVEARDAVMVGDDRRDIEAGRAAGCRTVAAAWGYVGDEDPASWAADRLIQRPIDLLAALAEL